MSSNAPIGETVFVTGANRGIGLGLIRELAKEASIRHVFAGYYEPNGVEELLKAQKQYPNIHPIPLDVTDDRSIKAAVVQVERVLIEGGHDPPILNLLINDAAILVLATPKVCAQEPDRQTFLDHINTNTMGVVMTTAAFLPMLKRAVESGHPAKVVNISSTAGSISMCYPYYNTAEGMVKNFPYGMSKAALNYYTKALAEDEPDVLVAAICPGWVRTEMGGPNAPTSVEECAAGLIQRIRRLEKKDSGKFMNVTDEIPY